MNCEADTRGARDRGRRAVDFPGRDALGLSICKSLARSHADLEPARSPRLTGCQLVRSSRPWPGPGLENGFRRNFAAPAVAEAGDLRQAVVRIWGRNTRTVQDRSRPHAALAG